MVYIKAIVAGIVGALAASVLWILVAFVAPILLTVTLANFGGSGGAGFVSIGSGSILVAALVGFVVGSLWRYRRLARKTVASRS